MDSIMKKLWMLLVAAIIVGCNSGPVSPENTGPTEAEIAEMQERVAPNSERFYDDAAGTFTGEPHAFLGFAEEIFLEPTFERNLSTETPEFMLMQDACTQVCPQHIQTWCRQTNLPWDVCVFYVEFIASYCKCTVPFWQNKLM